MRRTVGLGLWVLCLIAGCASSTENGPRGGRGAAGSAGMFGNATAGTTAGVSGIGGPAGTAGTAGVSGFGGVAGTDNSCASVRVNASRVIPLVQLVIDGSGSMEEPFGNTTRWGAVHDALLAEDGVVQRLDAVVQFGMSVYQTGGMAQGECPQLTGPAPALDNFDPIAAAWPPQPNGSTPTAEAMEAVVANMSGTMSNNPDGPPVGPQIIILATDGAPNGCAGANIDWLLWVGCSFINPMDPMCAGLNMMLANDGYARTLQAAHDAQAKGIRVYVLDLSDGGLNQAELQKVANVGAGLAEDAMPAAPLYVPADPAALATALETIIGGASTCTLQLEGELSNLDAACGAASIVQLNGNPISCADTDGWKVVDSTHIELVGAPCDQWLSSPEAVIDATFPCNVIRPD